MLYLEINGIPIRVSNHSLGSFRQASDKMTLDDLHIRYAILLLLLFYLLTAMSLIFPIFATDRIYCIVYNVQIQMLSSKRIGAATHNKEFI